MKDKRVILLLMGVLVVILLSGMNLYLLVIRDKIDTNQDAKMVQLASRLNSIESASKNFEYIQGEKGDSGLSIVGQRGATGVSGNNGKDGINGRDGVDGKDGSKGEPGESIDIRWNTCKVDELTTIEVLEKKRTSDDFWNIVMPTDQTLVSKLESLYKLENSQLIFKRIK